MLLFRKNISFSSSCLSRNYSFLGIIKKPFFNQDSEKSERINNEDQIEKIVNIDNVHIDTKVQKKCPPRRPLVKNFFVHEVDAGHLTYPQVIEQNDYEEITRKLKPFHQFFNDRAKTISDPIARDLSDESIADLCLKKLFSTSVNQRYGGFGFFSSETALASECDAVDVKFNEILSPHRIACEIIYNHGTDSQRNKYLLDLAKGKLFATIVPYEIQSKNASKIHAFLDTTGEKSEWVLNGTKSFVVKSKHANLLLVSAESTELSEYVGGNNSTEILTFIIDSKASGVKFVAIPETLGCIEVPYETIQLENVRVSNDNVLAELHEERTASDCLTHGSRLNMALLKTIQSKKVLNFLIEHILQSTYKKEPMINMQLFKHLLAKTAKDLYATESVLYHTWGMIDQFEKPKVDLETAIVAILANDTLSSVIELGLSYPNSQFLTNQHQMSENLQNCLQLRARGETSDNLKLFVGTEGVEHCRGIKRNKVKHFKDNIFERLMKQPKIVYCSKKLDLDEYVHPSLEEVITSVEVSIFRLFAGTNILIYNHRENAKNQKYDVKQLGEAAALCYAMYSSVARSSRSYCIGLRHSVYETVMSNCIVGHYSERILNSVLEIKNGRQNEDFQKISEIFLEKNGRKLNLTAVRHKKSLT